MTGGPPLYAVTLWVISTVWFLYCVHVAVRYGTGPLPKIWWWMKDLFYRLAHPGYSLARPAVVRVREPDWGDAADEAGFPFDPAEVDLYSSGIVAWTPEEREAAGINDTERFIDETDRILKTEDWNAMVARMERRRRRAGAQIVAGKAWPYGEDLPDPARVSS